MHFIVRNMNILKYKHGVHIEYQEVNSREIVMHDACTLIRDRPNNAHTSVFLLNYVSPKSVQSRFLNAIRLMYAIVHQQGPGLGNY